MRRASASSDASGVVALTMAWSMNACIPAVASWRVGRISSAGASRGGASRGDASTGVTRSRTRTRLVAYAFMRPCASWTSSARSLYSVVRSPSTATAGSCPARMRRRTVPSERPRMAAASAVVNVDASLSA